MSPREFWLGVLLPTYLCLHFGGRHVHTIQVNIHWKLRLSLEYREYSKHLEMDKTVRTIRYTFRKALESYSKFVPEDLLVRLVYFHERPQVWFVGQVVAFLLRMNDPIAKGYQQMKSKLLSSLPPGTPIFGIHARGDDKESEGGIIYLDQMMQFVPKEYSTIYLATDDPRNLKTAEEFRNYTWLMNRGDDDRISGVGDRHAVGALKNLIYDIYFLSECDHFLGDDGSNISRVVYELMQTKHLDASQKAWSIHTLLKDGKQYFFWYLH